MGKVKNIIIDTETSLPLKNFNLGFDHAMGTIDMIIEVDSTEQDMWWTTLKGENIRIDKMDTEHLKNALAHIKRTGRLKPPYAKRFKQVYRNMQIEYYRRKGPAGEVLFGKTKV